MLILNVIFKKTIHKALLENFLNYLYRYNFYFIYVKCDFISFGILLITKILAFYYMSIPLLDFSNKSHYYGGTEAKKDIIHAYSAYMDYGIITEYYDENNTKQQYKPSLKEIQLKKEYKTIEKDKKVFVKLFNEVPLNIVIAFLTMISAFYFSSILAKRKLKKI